MKFGVIVFPGSNCDHDAYHVVSKHVGQPVDFVWHKRNRFERLRRADRAGRIFLRRLFASRRACQIFAGDEGGQRFCGERKICFRHLQRFSDSLRKRSFARRVDAQPAICILSAVTSIFASKIIKRLIRANSKRAKFFRFRLRTPKEITFATTKLSMNSKQTIKLFFVTAMKTAKLPTKPIRTAHVPILRESAIRKEMFWNDAAPGTRLRRLFGSNDGRDIFRSLTKAIAEIKE